MSAYQISDVASGQVVLVRELLAAPRSIPSARVLLSVDSYDAELDQCWFRCACFPHDRLLVQTTRISPFDHGIGVVYAIIGEIDARDQPILKARVAVPMAGVDTKLYLKALALRRDFLREVVPTNDPNPVVMELDEADKGGHLTSHEATLRGVPAAKPAAGTDKQRSVVDLVDEFDEDEV